MPLPTYTVTCTSKTLIARDVYELRFTKPEGFAFKPGQFILFDVPLVDEPGDVQPRALSIASLPGEVDLLFVIKMIPGGRMSRWIHESLTEGSSMTYKGAFGNFVVDLGQARNLLFIATGAGIAPFRPMMKDAAQHMQGCRIDVVFGVRSEEDLFWKDWLEETSRVHDNVFHHIALSQPSGSWTGHKGRVQAVAPEVVRKDFSGISLYACGNPDMTNDVKRLALGGWGMEKKDVHVEGYI